MMETDAVRGRVVQGIVAIALIASLCPDPAVARDILGVYDGWAAVRDASPHRCFAIAEPDIRRRPAGWRPFASIGIWPDRARDSQFNVRLRRAKRPGAPVVLIMGENRFALIAGGGDAWAADPRADAAIVAAIRRSVAMTVVTRDRNGRPLIDSYTLSGAATAIDAALLACTRR